MPPLRGVKSAAVNATRFLYEASLKSAEVVTPAGKTIAMHPLVESGESGECRRCASETERGFSWAKVAKKTFTDHDSSRRPESPVICEYCVWALGWAPGISNTQGGLSTFRFYSIYATPEGVELPSRARWREILLSTPKSPYLACIAVSGKKWLHIKGRVGGPARWWDLMLEERRVILVPEALQEILAHFEALYAGFPKTQVESGDYSPPLISVFGVERFDRHERYLKAFRGADVFAVAAFVAQKPDKAEGKEEGCTTDSRPSEKRSESQLF